MVYDAFVLQCIRPLCGASKRTPENFWTEASLEARELARKTLEPIEKSFAPLDYHAHLIGNGIGLTPPAVHPDMLSWKHPFVHTRYLSYLSSVQLTPLQKDPDQFIRKHLHGLVKHVRDPSLLPKRSYRIQTLALDSYYCLDGKQLWNKTHFYVSNDYLMELVREYPDTFTPVFSIHPYRKDALEELDRCHEFFEKWRAQLIQTGCATAEEARQLPKMMKWLPNSMGIDPSHPHCLPFYERLIKYNFLLLSHTGEELAVSVDLTHQRLGNPLLLRTPLRAGVNIIVAHCAALGKNPDLDQGYRLEENLTLFLRMMKESLESPEPGEGKLYGDLSALSIFMCQKQLMTLLDSPEIHHRLVNGSDYPIPAINILIHIALSKYAGLITAEESLLLREIYHYNPLLMDFLFKRLCRHPKSGRQFPAELFSRIPNYTNHKK